MFKKEKLESVFLTEKNRYSKKKNLKVKNIVVVLSLALLAILVLGIIFEKKEIRTREQPTNYFNNLPHKNPSLLSKYKEPEYDDIKIEDAPKPITKTSFSKDALIGSKQAVELLGKVISNSRGVVPIRVKTITHKNSKDYELDFRLKEGTLLLGKGRVDRLSKRLHITFHSLLIKGKRISIQAKAFMEDGTFGVKGEYNSGELKKYGSRFGSNFIGGVSQGLKEKTITKSGNVLELGGLKNAILNGLSLSFLDFAQDKARGNENPSAVIIIPDKTKFFVYFEN